jgi:hypothetical protein
VIKSATGADGTETTVTCTGATPHAIGGGVKAGGASRAVSESQPVGADGTAATGWKGNTNGGGTAGTMTVWAICAP